MVSKGLAIKRKAGRAAHCVEHRGCVQCGGVGGIEGAALRWVETELLDTPSHLLDWSFLPRDATWRRMRLVHTHLGRRAHAAHQPVKDGVGPHRVLDECAQARARLCGFVCRQISA
eukprot:1038195-Pleurochrysis_carterae.AAC.4